MTTYRLFPTGNGPALTSDTGNLLSGVAFQVTQGGMWLEGYWWWVPSGGDTGAQKFALWNLTGSAAATLVPSSTVTSGTLTAGSWNFVPLAAPVPIAIGTPYIACTGWVMVHGFPITNAQFGSGDPFSGGITQGPLMAYADSTAGGSPGTPFLGSQGLFSTTRGADPTANWPNGGSGSANFWMDLSVSDTGPAGYTGPYSLWPNNYGMNSSAVADSSFNYDIGQVFTLSQPCAVNAIRYFSPPGTAQLATECGIWSVTGGGLTGSLLIDDTSPTWSGAAASGWVQRTFASPVVLAAGTYKAFVYNDAATPDGWSAKDASTNYWATGSGANGITWGPLSAPDLASAPLANKFGGSGTEPGQNVFSVGPPNTVPNEYVDGLAQWYGVDLLVTPSASYTSIGQGSKKVIAVPAGSIIQGSKHTGAGAS